MHIALACGDHIMVAIFYTTLLRSRLMCNDVPSPLQILLKEFNVQSALLCRRPLTTDASLLRTDASSSKMAAFFPKSVATVHNRGAPLPLLYQIEVDRSSPLTHCFLTCKTRADGEEDQQSGRQHRKS